MVENDDDDDDGDLEFVDKDDDVIDDGLEFLDDDGPVSKIGFLDPQNGKQVLNTIFCPHSTSLLPLPKFLMLTPPASQNRFI